MTLPAALRTSAAHVFVDHLKQPQLDERDAHHLGRVLRLRDGQPVTIGDGSGRWCSGVWRVGGVEIDGEVRSGGAPPALTVATAIPKGDRLEWMVQKLTEVGVASICLVECARSVVRWDAARAQAQHRRLARIARDAAMQSRRLWLPELCGPLPLSAVLGGDGVVVADPAGEPIGEVAATTVVVGPEGGLTAEEVGGTRLVSLGDHVLRVETAAIVAAVLASSGR